MDRHIQILEKAVTQILRAGKASPAFLRKVLQIGAEDARHLMQELRWLGIVGPDRRALISAADWRTIRAG